MVTLSIVIPATDDPSTLGRARAAAVAAAGPDDELIVVDEPADMSAAGARNAGAARATRDVVVFVDADVEVHADALARLRRAFGAADAPDAVYGSYDDAPAAPGVVSRFRNLLHHHVHHQGAGPTSTFWTGLGGIRRDVFLASGGFDELRYPHPSIEDIELGHRLVADGARIELDPSIQGTHLKHWTLVSMLTTDLFRRGVPWVALQARERRLSAELNLSWRHRLSAITCAVGVAALALRLPVVAGAALGTLVGLNFAFYRLLVRRQGVVHGGAGVVLHGAHHLTSLLAVPVGLAVAASAGAITLVRGRRPASPSAEHTVTP